MELQKTGEIFSLKKCFSKDFSKFDQESESTFITLQRVVLGVRLLVRLDPSMTAERFHFSTILPKSAIKLTSFHAM